LFLGRAYDWCGTLGGPTSGVINFAPPKLLTAFADRSITAELKGNQQAQDIKAGVSSLGGLKKGL
jgi:hypothetical protein